MTRGILALRFDDTLDTVLATDMATPFGRQSAYRQLVDLIGRRRVPPETRAIETLLRLAQDVSLAHRTAAARGLAFANPPAELVRIFARDELAVAAPVLRTARLESAEWCDLVSELAPSTRAILRHRRDLDAVVGRALAAFGPVDFVLADDRAIEAVAPEPVAEVAPAPGAEPIVAPRVQGPFAAFGSVAFNIPVVAEAVRRSENAAPAPEPATEGPFRIADVVARIDAFREARERARPHANDAAIAPGSDRFRFETDARGVVCWTDEFARPALIGLSLSLAGGSGVASLDGVAAGAFRQRARFRDARLTIAGEGATSGAWLMAATPNFDPATGRFLGYRGMARRPHPGETAAPVVRQAGPPPDAMRQLVHELRTPTNAIIGFSEMIAMQMLGPVDTPYRDHAEAIHRHARNLLGAIDDLDLAARIESDALVLRPESVSLRAVIGAVAHDLAPLAELRGATIVPPESDGAISGDRQAIERLFGRLIATLLSATSRGERLTMALAADDGYWRLSIDRPAGLPNMGETSSEADMDEDDFAALPLGTGFALRLAGNLARQLGGGILFDSHAIEVRLPAMGEDAARTATKS